MANRQKVLDFIRQQKYMVISAVKADGTPDAAFIGLGSTDKLEILFGTSNTTRKYAALMNNSKVAIVIGGHEKITVQYEGVAEELAGDNAKQLKEYYLEQNPSARAFERNDDQRYFIVRPSWLRYSDYNQGPPEIFELTDF